MSAPPPPQLLQLRPSCCLPLSAFQLLLLPLHFLPAPPRPLPALLLLFPAPPPLPLRYSQACHYAGEKGLLGPGLPLYTSATALQAYIRGCATST